MARTYPSAARPSQLHFRFVLQVYPALLKDLRRRNDWRARMVDAFADFAGLFPALWIGDIPEPPGISATLRRARLVDVTSPIRQEYAIGRSGPIGQRPSSLDDAGVLARESTFRQLKEVGQSFEIDGRQKHGAGRAGAALAATRAFESKAAFEPSILRQVPASFTEVH